MDKRYSPNSFFIRLKRNPCKGQIESKTKSGTASIQHEPLERILKDKLLSELFHDWAAQNLCSENLLFYYEVEKYKTIRDPNFMKAEAFRIHTKFVQPRAVAEVNLDYECRSAIEAELGNPTTNLFDEAKFVVTDLIKYDLYLKFLDSDIYRKFKGFPSANRHPTERRRNVHLADMPHLTHDQISSLTKCLSDPLALDEFLKFTYNEFSDAVVQFYLDVERYEVAPSIEFACTIYSKYLGYASEEEVDTDPKIKKTIWQTLQLGQCPSDLFSKLKVQAYAVMVQDNFMRFQNYIISSLAMV